MPKADTQSAKDRQRQQRSQRSAPFRFLFVDGDGKSHRIRNPRKLLLLIRHNIIDADTPILDEVDGVWVKAGKIKAFQVCTGTYQHNTGHTESAKTITAPPTPAASRFVDQLKSVPRSALAIAASAMIAVVCAGFFASSSQWIEAGAPIVASTPGTSDKVHKSLASQAPAKGVAVTDDSGADGPDTPEASPATISGTPVGTVQEKVAQLEQIRERYSEVLDIQELSVLSAPEALADKALILSSNQQVKEYFKAVSQFAQDYQRTLGEMEKSYRALRASNPDNEQLPSRLQGLLVEATERFDTLHNLYRETLSHLDEIHDFLLRSDGQYLYSQQDNALQFDRNSEAEHYQSLVTSLDGFLADTDQLLALMERESWQYRRLF